jgi:hypothetical protein
MQLVLTTVTSLVPNTVQKDQKQAKNNLKIAV